jgi:hypothetical protein
MRPWSCSSCSIAWKARARSAVLRPGEQAALWALSCRLESVLADPFEVNYGELVNHARRRLADRSGA